MGLRTNSSAYAIITTIPKHLIVNPILFICKLLEVDLSDRPFHGQVRHERRHWFKRLIYPRSVPIVFAPLILLIRSIVTCFTRDAYFGSSIGSMLIRLVLFPLNMIISYCSEVSKCLLQWADNLMYLRSKPGSTILCFPTIAYLPYGDTKAKLSRVQIAITNGIYYMANLLMAMPLNVFCYVISQVMPMISVPDVDLRKSLKSSQDPELCYYDRNAAGLFHLLASVLILPVILIVAILLPPTNSSIERIIPSEGSSVLKNITRYVCIVFFACTGMFLLSTLIDRMSMAVQDAIEDENQHKKAGRRLTQGFSTPRSGVNLTVQASDRTPRPVFIMTASLNHVASALKLKQSARVILSFLRETLIIFAPILFFRYNRASLSYYCNPPGAGGSLHIRGEPCRDDFILDPRPNDPDSIELLLVPIPEDPGTTTRSEKGPEIIVDGGMRGCYGE